MRRRKAIAAGKSSRASSKKRFTVGKSAIIQSLQIRPAQENSATGEHQHAIP
jgi:hypothetical protein